MAKFTFGIDLNCKTNAYIELSGNGVKYWENLGLPVFEGDLEGLSKAHPEVIKELIDRKIISEA